MKNNWKENKIVKRIIELQKTYVFRHMYAGCYVGEDIEHMSKCSCCGTLSSSLESLYHKDPESNDGISICPTCSALWRAVGKKLMEEEKLETV